MLTKTKQPELCRYWTTRDRAANVRLFRLASEVLRAVDAGVFPPIVGWQCKECQFGDRCWAWRCGRRRSACGRRDGRCASFCEVQSRW